MCDDLVIDASSSYGSAGRQWEYVNWEITKDNFVVDDIQIYLSTLATLLSPFKLPGNLFETDSYYSLSLTLRNFFGVESTVTKEFFKSSQGDIPKVSFLGQSSISIKPSDVLIAVANGETSPCSTSKTLSYSWTLYKSFVYQNIISTSVDPRRYRLPSFSLSAGGLYQLRVEVFTVTGATAYSLLEIYVVHDILLPIVYGGYARVNPLDTMLSLDGSGSLDLDYPESEEINLNYLWSCNYMNPSLFGVACNEVISSNLNSSSITVQPYGLELDSLYQFTLSISSIDGRSASVGVLVEPSRAGSPVLLISSMFSVINSDQILSITGSISAKEDLGCFWEVVDPSINLDIASLTSVSRSFSAETVSQTVQYPLSVSANTFTPGRKYTFRLVAYPSTKPDLISYSEFTIEINSPPSQGSISVNPEQGFALSTIFSLILFGWVDDASSYPLSYGFMYSLAPDGLKYSLQSKNFKQFLDTKLPSGLKIQSFVVFCVGVASDTFGSESFVNQGVLVTLDESVDTSVGAVDALSDLDASFQSFGKFLLFISFIYHHYILNQIHSIKKL